MYICIYYTQKSACLVSKQRCQKFLGSVSKISLRVIFGMGNHV